MWLTALMCTLALGCAETHERDPFVDAAVPRASDAGPPRDAARLAVDDAAVPHDPCAAGRIDTLITPPRARRAGYSVLLHAPRVASASDRISAVALVLSDARGGMGISDVLTMRPDGSDQRAFFTSDVPYVIGTTPLEEFIGGGGFYEGTHVYAEVRRFDVTRFDVARSDDGADASPEPRLSAPLDPADSGPPHFEMSRDGSRALYLSGRRGLVIYEASSGALTEIERSHVGEPVLSFVPPPRLSPRGERVAFVNGEERRSVHVRDIGSGREHTFALDVDPAALAFLGEERVLVMAREDEGTLDVIDLRDGATSRLALGLRAGEHVFEAFDVSVDGRSFVITEEQGARLHVVRCDPTLVSIAGS